jgi:hypothetical protein
MSTCTGTATRGVVSTTGLRFFQNGMAAAAVEEEGRRLAEATTYTRLADPDGE